MSYIENTIAGRCGGAAGAVCRFKLNAAIMSGLTLAFPLGILCINVLGGFLMGLLQGAMKRSGKPFTVGYSLLGTGFLGGFTTFSSFSLETVTLIEGGSLFYAAMNIAANLGLCFLTTFLGLGASRALSAL